MTAMKSKRTRRAFFLQSGAAALGAGVAATVGASAKSNPLEEREAIRQLQLTFAALMENQSYEAAAQLFDEQASVELSGVSANGQSAILQLLTRQYRNQQAAVMHSAYRANASQQNDRVALRADGSQATATWHVDVRLSTPLQGDCTAAQMARLQGQTGDCRWESGRLEAKYVKTDRAWRILSLRYRES